MAVTQETAVAATQRNRNGSHTGGTAMAATQRNRHGSHTGGSQNVPGMSGSHAA